jgi:hypothetical protein
MAVYGPMGQSSVGTPPPTPAPVQNNQTNAAQEGLDQTLSGLQSGYQATAAAQNQGLVAQQQQAAAQQGVTDTQAQQSYNNTLQQLGITQTGLGQQQQYQNQSYGLTQQGNTLTSQGLQESLANLQQQYGFTQQGLALQNTEANQNYGQSSQQLAENSSASGVLNTGSQRQAQGNLQTSLADTLQSLGIQGGQAASNYQYGLQQNSNAQGQLGLQEQQQSLSNTYGNQQIANSLANLGLQRTEAGQGLTNAQQQAGITYGNIASQIKPQQATNSNAAIQQYEQLVAQLEAAGAPS